MIHNNFLSIKKTRTKKNYHFLTIFKPIYECKSLVNKPKICIIQVIKILFPYVKNFSDYFSPYFKNKFINNEDRLSQN